jgi:bifunctional pyridoxal-dependent enzyme with beta-cystathionase and maltose regulon repressor activities
MDRFVKDVDSQKWRGNHHSQDYFVMTIADMDLPLFPAFREAILNKLSLTNNFTYKYPSQQYYNSII